MDANLIMHLKSEMVFPFYSSLQLYALLSFGRPSAIAEYKYKGDSLVFSGIRKGKPNLN